MPLMFQPLARYADFNGRSRRSEYWLWALFYFLANVFLAILQFSSLFFAAGAGSNGNTPAVGGLYFTIMGLRVLFWLGLVIPHTAVAVRRFHDINRTGWWVVFPTAIMIISLIGFFALSGGEWVTAVQNMKNLRENDPAAFGQGMTILRPFLWVFLLWLLAKIVTLVLRVMDGTPGPNRFGPDPKSRGVSNVF